jgi:nucleotide-binding universal stress UspA family protein
MFKRILVPVDGSATGAAGLKLAVRLAREGKARVRLVHLSQIVAGAPPAGGMLVSQLYNAIRASGEAVVAKAARACRSARVPCDTRLAVAMAGRASDVILEEARKWRADLIVMGTHGRRGLQRLALGSDAERVARAARVPLLLVRARDRSRRWI